MLQIIALISLTLLALTGCIPFPGQDCGVLKNALVMGQVLDNVDRPIKGARIRIVSKKLNECLGSTSIPDVEVLSEADGTFKYVLPYVWQDDIMDFSAEAEGFSDYTISIAYSSTLEDLTIRLYPEK